MTRDRSDAHEIVYEPARGPKRRVRFEPHSAGDWMRIAEVWTGCTWRPTGREVVRDLTVDGPNG